jgi:hypothetical protein
MPVEQAQYDVQSRSGTARRRVNQAALVSRAPVAKHSSANSSALKEKAAEMHAASAKPLATEEDEAAA